MLNDVRHALTQAVESLGLRCPGPGGAVAIVREGVVEQRFAWGFADLARRVPMTAQTRMPFCSITKQMLCALVLDLVKHPSELQPLLDAYLPHLDGPRPTVAQLCHNQSGLRDYWALSVLDGADPEGLFRPEDARRRLKSLRSTQFPPGTQYAYANTNFRILADLIGQHTGRPLAELLTERIFEPAGMGTALFCPDTARHPAPCMGYEGDPTHGFRPAVNRIHWAGDAGVCGALDDLIAWEQLAQKQAALPDSLYGRLLAAPTFADGQPSCYGFGLGHALVDGVPTVGHGGAVRGWRLHRLHAVQERLSVVVMFNHHADAAGTAEHLLRVAMGRVEDPDRCPVSRASPRTEPEDPGATGAFFSDTTQLALTVTSGEPGSMVASFAGYPEVLHPVVNDDGPEAGGSRLESREMRLQPVDGGWRMVRIEDHLDLTCRAIGPAVRPVSGGRFHCAEIGSTFTCVRMGAVLYGAFEGFLGQGGMHTMRPLGEDVWLLACPRGMDAPAPGDWTVVFGRDGEGTVDSVTIGCWLARGLHYHRAGSP